MSPLLIIAIFANAKYGLQYATETRVPEKMRTYTKLSS